MTTDRVFRQFLRSLKSQPDEVLIEIQGQLEEIWLRRGAQSVKHLAAAARCWVLQAGLVWGPAAQGIRHVTGPRFELLPVKYHAWSLEGGAELATAACKTAKAIEPATLRHQLRLAEPLERGSRRCSMCESALRSTT